MMPDENQDVTRSEKPRQAEGKTEGKPPSEEELKAAFRNAARTALRERIGRRIPKTAPRSDAMKGDLSWAGRDVDPKKMHGRKLGALYAEEDKRSNAFPPGTARSNLGGDDRWTTLYGVSSAATMHKSVASAGVSGGGLIVDSSGQPLDGMFGYVVAGDGTFYTFDQDEQWVTLNGEWIDVRGSGQSAAMLIAALKRGEKYRAVHHSTAVSGQPVAGAGTMRVINGKIMEITNDSGHYQPEAEYLWQTMEWLAAQGMPVEDISVCTVAATRDAPAMLKAWKFRLSGGNVAQVSAKDKAMTELAILALPAGDLKRVHFAETGQQCTNLVVMEEGGTLKCRVCNADLNPKYGALLPQVWIPALPPDDLRHVHLQEKSCTNLMVADVGGLYCSACEAILDERYRALIPAVVAILELPDDNVARRHCEETRLKCTNLRVQDAGGTLQCGECNANLDTLFPAVVAILELPDDNLRRQHCEETELRCTDLQVKDAGGVLRCRGCGRRLGPKYRALLA